MSLRKAYILMLYPTILVVVWTVFAPAICWFVLSKSIYSLTLWVIVGMLGCIGISAAYKTTFFEFTQALLVSHLPGWLVAIPGVWISGRPDFIFLLAGSFIFFLAIGWFVELFRRHSENAPVGPALEEKHSQSETAA